MLGIFKSALKALFGRKKEFNNLPYESTSELSYHSKNSIQHLSGKEEGLSSNEANHSSQSPLESALETRNKLRVKKRAEENTVKELEKKNKVDFPEFARHPMSYIVTSTRGVYEQRQTVYSRI